MAWAVTGSKGFRGTRRDRRARQSLFDRHGKTGEFDRLSKAATNLLRMRAED